MAPWGYEYNIFTAVIQVTKTLTQRGRDKKRTLLWKGSNTGIKVFNEK